jgi:hypothetical protein
MANLAARILPRFIRAAAEVATVRSTDAARPEHSAFVRPRSRQVKSTFCQMNQDSAVGLTHVVTSPLQWPLWRPDVPAVRSWLCGPQDVRRIGRCRHMHLSWTLVILTAVFVPLAVLSACAVWLQHVERRGWFARSRR